MIAARTALLAAVALALIAAPASAHRYFASLAEVELDEARGALEVALRIDDHNLEDALRLTHGADFALPSGAAGGKWARGYVDEHFVVLTDDGTELPLEWVGWEWSPGAAWLYFEFAVPQDATLSLENTVFLELSERQINTVNLRTGSARRTLTFDRTHKTYPLTNASVAAED